MKSENSKTLFAVGNRFSAFWPFLDLFKELKIVDSLQQILPLFKEGDVVLFEGGEDISPSLYNEELDKHSDATDRLSKRDKIELEIFEALENRAKFLGICRGAQLLCALSGGKLIQHLDGHTCAGHYISTEKGENYWVSSTHHQAQWPWKIEHKLIAWSAIPRSKRYLGTIDNEFMYFPKNAYDKALMSLLEPEVVFYPHTKSLAIQFHPEFMDESEKGVTYAKNLVKEYLLND